MRKSLGRITVFAVMLSTLSLGLFLIAVWTVDDAIRNVPELHVRSFDTSKPTALSFVVFDVQTGTEIASKDASRVLPVASLTKLLAASVFYDTTPLSATTSITWSDVNGEGRAGRLEAKDIYSYRELMYPLLLESSNDAAGAMLRVDPRLLEDMNAYVKALGLTETYFIDPSGLSSKNVSSAHDLSILARVLYGKYGHIFDITRLHRFIGTHTGWLNNNPLVDQEGYRGGKHGYTYEANRTDIAFFEETLQTGQKRIIGYVLLGSGNILADITLLRQEVAENVTVE